MISERGSMTVVMMAAVTIVAVLGIAVSGLGVVYAARAQAAAAADAAALAAAVATYPPASGVPPHQAAARAAERNGASVIGCRCPVDADLGARTVEVVAGVEVLVPVFGEIAIRASSRAEFDPMRWLGR